jgi:hypothetical protein
MEKSQNRREREGKELLDSQVVEDVSQGSPELLSTGNDLSGREVESVASSVAKLCKLKEKMKPC